MLLSRWRAKEEKRKKRDLRPCSLQKELNGLEMMLEASQSGTCTDGSSISLSGKTNQERKRYIYFMIAGVVVTSTVVVSK